MELPKRKRTRMRHFDYSRKGAYFITICTQDRQQILADSVLVGDVEDAIPYKCGNSTYYIHI